jgi:hypothetical protein
MKVGLVGVLYPRVEEGAGAAGAGCALQRRALAAAVSPFRCITTRSAVATFGYFSCRTDNTFPDGSLNQAM